MFKFLNKNDKSFDDKFVLIKIFENIYKHKGFHFLTAKYFFLTQIYNLEKEILAIK